MKKHLSAMIGNKKVYLELDNVLEAIESYEFRIIPDQKNNVLGIAYYRDDLIPIVSIGEYTLNKNLIILKYKSKIAGLAVSDVKNIETLSFINQLQPTDNPYLDQFEGGLVLNVERLMGHIL
jgi:chemotaxis signal transduction protein